ncbi:hypothetical protein RhiJN_02142 [Ceratobasidium sp. AG-Ba]|nr:hypothetical protein RhiJN_02142 [Ceratobasidium sp. AG-Ba]QRW03074.1 hypothetical protein RhiLY_02073 [Ceratobasidium sp. AG-Ba]
MTLTSHSETGTLPLEILLNILEVLFATDDWDSVLSKQPQLLLINRETYRRFVHVFYRTVFLKTHNQAVLFLHTIRLSPYLGKLVSNLWVSASTSDILAHESGLSPKLLSIYTPNLRRLSLPRLPSSMGVVGQEKNPFLPRLHTLCVQSMPKREFFLRGIPQQLENLQRLFVHVPAEKEEADTEISAGLWVMALIAIIGSQPIHITELVIKVPAHPSNEACIGQIRINKVLVAIGTIDTSLDEERATYGSWLSE